MNKKTPNSALNRLDVTEYKDAKKNQIFLILDNIRSAQNVGSMFRTMDAFRGASIYLCGITAQPPHKEINKTALGATETVSWVYFESTLDAVKHLQSNKIAVYALEQASEAVELQNLRVSKEKGIGLVVGNEVDGVAQEVINAADGVAEIPQYGSKHSLNVSVCAGIALWHCLMEIKP
jgi:tRNA G18 (ribose-2'-O)-methylase SpoU